MHHATDFIAGRASAGVAGRPPSRADPARRLATVTARLRHEPVSRRCGQPA
jgi:hypothetical protein